MNFIRDISTYSEYEPQEGDLLKLFQLAIKENVKREDAVSFFSSNGYFRKVYKQLKDRLLDGILLNSFKELSTYQKAQITIRKRSLEGRMLLYTEKKEAGIKVIEETFWSAEKYGMLDICLSMSKELFIHYSVIKANKIKRWKYIEAVSSYQKKTKEEWFAQKTYADLAYSIKKKESLENVLKSIELLETIVKHNEEYNFRLYYYSVKNLYARLKGNQEEIINNCKEASSFFQQSTTILPYTTAWNFKFQMIPVYLTKKHFGNASIMIKECLELPSKGSYNWHLTLLYKAVLGFYSQKRMVVLNAWKDAQKVRKNFKSEEVEERWKIIGAYLALFQKVGQLNYPKEFRSARFQNDTKANDTAKINMKILELLHLLLDGKEDVYMNRVEHIEQYISTNCKGKPRPKYFLRMLRAVELGDYNALRVEAHAKKHRDLLRRTASTININVLDSEPVPYPVLWEMVLNHLRT